MKQCQNKECNSYIEDNDLFCRVCGLPQKPAKKGLGLFKRKAEQTAQVRGVEANEFEDFRLASPVRYQQPQQSQKSEVMDKLEKLEEQLNVMLKNNTWLLLNVENWLNGYRQKEEKVDEEDIEKNI